MNASAQSLALGAPRFPHGLQSWQDTLDKLGPEQAALQTQGSFAVVQRLPDGGVFMAVDRFAIQTLCWTLQGNQLRWAERAEALGGEIDPQALFGYLYFHAIPSPQTVFGGVQRLSAGHYAVFDGREVRVRPYWTPRFTARTAAPASLADLKASFRDLLRTATAAQLDGSPAACFLSGGTDSSTVVGSAAQLAGRVSSYSIGFDAEGYDEMEYARIAARHFGTDHHEYYVTPDDLVRSIGEVARWHDQPFGNSSALPAYYCALQARKDGVSKLLAGDGGDELFGGNSRYATQRLYGLHGKAPASLRWLFDTVFDTALIKRTPLLKKGSSYARDARIPLPDRLHHYNLIRRLGLSEVLTPEFMAQVSPALVDEQQREVWAQAEAHNELDRQLAFDWRYTLAESDLPKVRGATCMAGVEVGYPLLDARLVDFSMTLPEHYKLRGLKLRWFFKEALRDFLPPQIITKKKKGFGLPFGVWANRHEGLKALARESVLSFGSRGIVREQFVRELLDTHMPAHPGYYGEMVWILMMCEQWLRGHKPNYKLGS